ncbi:hypothetical protein GY45DRAFT_1328045 [Cubamyces sp. BRFM 1775]|nr:hypothetical protein GY45DRAFT_1328045 [Cubamyces sp. BRFM 1775]
MYVRPTLPPRTFGLFFFFSFLCSFHGPHRLGGGTSARILGSWYLYTAHGSHIFSLSLRSSYNNIPLRIDTTQQNFERAAPLVV